MNEQKHLTGYPSIDKPWLKYYSEEAKTAPLPECSIYEYLLENNMDFPKDIAINYLGRKITYGELFQRIDETAAAFAAIGVKQKDIVTIALPSIPEALYAVYALNKIGAVANMIHPLAGRQEIIDYLIEVGSRAAVLFDGTYKLLEGDLSATKLHHAVIVSAGDSMPFGIKQLYSLKNKKPELIGPVPMTWRGFIKAGKGTTVPNVNKDVNDTAIISHTGGTTGEPKGVMCSDNNINALIWQIDCNLAHERQERYLVVLPPFINYSLVNAMLEPLAFGFQDILLPAYNPAKFDEYIKKYKPNHISSIPTYWEAILKQKEKSSVDYSCLSHIYYGGEAMSPDIEKKVNEALLSGGARHPLCKGLGSTELTSAATVTYDDCNMLGSVGIPLVKINVGIFDNKTNEEQTYNEIGEICFSGPTVMFGYYNKPDETAKVVHIHADGQRWLHTGDLGYINEDGVLFVTGRIKRLIMTKGKDGNISKLFPDRIEKIVGAHPAVRACCVVGVPDKERIHFAKAYVELNDWYSPSEALASEICLSCKDKLPDYQIPDEGEFIKELPRTERGKVDYRALEEMARKETRD